MNQCMFLIFTRLFDPNSIFLPPFSYDSDFDVHFRRILVFLTPHFRRVLIFFILFLNKCLGTIWASLTQSERVSPTYNLKICMSIININYFYILNLSNPIPNLRIFTLIQFPLDKKIIDNFYCSYITMTNLNKISLKQSSQANKPVINPWT